jgi:hypothetical protein
VITTPNGPPLAPSFLSSLASTPPVSIPTPLPPPAVVPASSSHYTRLELANVHFVHSLALLEHVVCSKQARQILFPLIIQNDKQSKFNFEKKEIFISLLVYVKDILRVFIQIMFTGNSGSKEFISKQKKDFLLFVIEAASSLCCQLLKRLCLESDTCGPLMCSDDVFDTLVKPIKQFLGSKKMFNDYLRSNINIIAERGLIRLAELFSAMASNDIGYQYLIRIPTTQNT